MATDTIPLSIINNRANPGRLRSWGDPVATRRDPDPIAYQGPKNSNKPDDDSSLDLTSYATRKTVTGGALGIGLIASNVDQILAIVVDSNHGSYKSLDSLEITKVALLGMSLFVQIVTMILMTILGFVGKMTSERKKRHNRINTATMILSFITIVLNVAITSFNGKSI